MKKKVLSVLLALCLVMTLFPTVVLAVGGTYGAFTVTGDDLSGVSYASNVLTVSSAAPVTISQTAGVSPSTTDRIEVTSAANITLNGVNIDVSGTNYTAAFRITSFAGEVNITLATGSTNTLKSGIECAGLQKDTTAEGTMLTIDGTGTLNAIGKDDINYAGSGIGGGYRKAGSYITITGGTVNATGGHRCAGIGGGHQATGSSITITGGTVNATGGNMGAGIGGGSWSTGSNITISGGTVNAIASGFGEGIGRGYNGTSSTNITINGGSVKASSIGGPPTNGVANVYKAVIPIAGDTTGDIDVSSMTFVSNGSPYTYNMTGAKSILESGAGKVYVYLPGSSGGIAASASYGGITYVATVKNDNTAVFAPPSYSITYNLDGGTNGANPDTYNVATATITLANATKTGYTFAGWFDAASGGTQVTQIALGSTGAKTLYARWTINQYTISFDSAGGSGVDAITQNYNSAVTAPAGPTKTGYTFAGWSPALPATMPAENITHTAQWDTITYNINYNLDGGTNGANPATYNVATATITLAGATKTGYTFAGWFDAASGGTQVTQIALGSTGAKTLYARWTQDTYGITYNLDGGTNGANPATYNVETETITLADATKAGYTFAGWFDAESGGTQVTQIIQGSTGAKTLYARWTQNTYGVILAPAANKTFAAAKEGYGAQTAHSVIVTNSGNQATGALTVALSGTNAGSFTLSKTTIASLAVSGTDSFTVTPNAGLTADTYTATVTVSGGNGISESFDVSFTVNSAPTPSTGGGTAPNITVPASSDAGSVNVKATVSGGTADITVTETQLAKIATGSDTDTGTVKVDVSSLKVDAAVIPAKLITAAAGASGSNGLEAEFSTGSVALDVSALESIGNNSITISIEEVKPTELTASQKETLGDKADTALVVDVNVLVNGVKTSNFGGGLITISVLYTPKAGEDTSKLAVWYLKDDGSIEQMNGKYNTTTNCYEFTTTHLSTYVLTSFPFVDIASDSYYYSAVAWAVANGVTDGTTPTTFSPKNICTRAQMVTFLWRAMGSPEPTSITCPLTDVASDDYYYKAVLWAAEKSITEGTSATTFSPDDTVTRAQVVTLEWRAAGKPAAIAANPFKDVASGTYYEDAVLWAVAQKITDGTSTTTFNPIEPCTRAQIVTFLYRYLAK